MISPCKSKNKENFNINFNSDQKRQKIENQENFELIKQNGILQEQFSQFKSKMIDLMVEKSGQISQLENQIQDLTFNNKKLQKKIIKRNKLIEEQLAENEYQNQRFQLYQNQQNLENENQRNICIDLQNQKENLLEQNLNQEKQFQMIQNTLQNKIEEQLNFINKQKKIETQKNDETSELQSQNEQSYKAQIELQKQKNKMIQTNLDQLICEKEILNQQIQNFIFELKEEKQKQQDQSHMINLHLAQIQNLSQQINIQQENLQSLSQQNLQLQQELLLQKQYYNEKESEFLIKKSLFSLNHFNYTQDFELINQNIQNDQQMSLQQNFQFSNFRMQNYEINSQDNSEKNSPNSKNNYYKFSPQVNQFDQSNEYQKQMDPFQMEIANKNEELQKIKQNSEQLKQQLENYQLQIAQLKMELHKYVYGFDGDQDPYLQYLENQIIRNNNQFNQEIDYLNQKVLTLETKHKKYKEKTTKIISDLEKKNYHLQIKQISNIFTDKKKKEINLL